MIRTKVLVGESCVGYSSMKVPPYKPDGEAFDSICDAKPQIINISNN